MALLKPHHLNCYHSLRLIMSSRFLLPTHGLSICPSPPSIVLLQPRSNLGVRMVSTNRVLVPRALVSPRAFMSSVTEVRKGKDGSEHYGSENIQILEGLEAVRKRPGMYIGNTGPRGLHHMVYEILDNGVDEAQAGFASKVDIVLHADGSVCITDNGRGIPIDLHPGSKKSGVETVLTVLHAGGKFGGESSGYKVSGGLHGVGLSVVNALSETLEVTVWRDGKECHQIYFRGKPHKPLACKDLPPESEDRTGTCIKFWPDSEIFTSGTEFDYDTIAARVRERAFLVPGLTITLTKEDEDPEKNRTDEYCFAGGLVEYVKWLNADKVEELRIKSFEPYAYKWDRTHTAKQLQEMYKHLGNGEELNGENDQVSVLGRIVARRAFGNLAFLALRDDSGTIQLFCEKERLVKDQFEQLKSLVDIGDILGASGSIKRTEKGELSVCVNSFLILTNSLLGSKETISPAISVNVGKSVDDLEVVFSVLDAILKYSLDQLKLMRENMSRGHIGHYNYTLRAPYTQHIDAIRNLSWNSKLGVALWLRNKMIQKGVVPDVVTHNHLVHGFCKVGDFEKAEWLVREMCCWGPPPNCATYNTLMKGYCAFNDIDKALDLLSTMTDGKVKPNIVTFNILVHALCKKGLLEEARVLLLKLTDENSEKNLVASTIVMDNCFKNGDTSMALTLWGEICERNKQVDVVAYNVIVNGSCLNWDVIVAYKYVNEMFKIGLLPDNFTYNTLISALCKVGRVDEACYIYTVMSRMGVDPDEISYNVLIEGLCTVGEVVMAHELLNFMLEKSMVPALRTWNIVIDGYGKHGDKKMALHIKDKMVTSGVSPNVFTYNALIHMLVKREEIEEAHSLMKKMLLSGPLPDIVTYNLLVGAESKFGHLYSAYQVYDDMLKRGYDPDIITYTELIKGYCTRGKVKEADRFFGFDVLQDSKLAIDHVPFQILMKKHFKMNDYDSAYAVYQKWLRMDQAE